MVIYREPHRHPLGLTVEDLTEKAQSVVSGLALGRNVPLLVRPRLRSQPRLPFYASAYQMYHNSYCHTRLFRSTEAVSGGASDVALRDLSPFTNLK